MHLAGGTGIVLFEVLFWSVLCLIGFSHGLLARLLVFDYCPFSLSGFGNATLTSILVLPSLINFSDFFNSGELYSNRLSFQVFNF